MQFNGISLKQFLPWEMINLLEILQTSKSVWFDM